MINLNRLIKTCQQLLGEATFSLNTVRRNNQHGGIQRIDSFIGTEWKLTPKSINGQLDTLSVVLTRNGEQEVRHAMDVINPIPYDRNEILHLILTKIENVQRNFDHTQDSNLLTHKADWERMLREVTAYTDKIIIIK